MAQKIVCLGTALIVSFCVSAFPAHTDQENMSIQSRYNKGLLDGLETPRYLWLPNGRIILQDPRVEESRRTIEYYDPDSGRRTPALDPAKLLSSLKKCYEGNDFRSMRWPDAIDRNGKSAAYILGGDLFIVNFQSSAVKRLTTTPAAETSASFSPDGKWLGFIRENDLFVWNLETNRKKSSHREPRKLASTGRYRGSIGKKSIATPMSPTNGLPIRVPSLICKRMTRRFRSPLL